MKEKKLRKVTKVRRKLPKVKTDVKAGGMWLNHNETVVKA